MLFNAKETFRFLLRLRQNDYFTHYISIYKLSKTMNCTKKGFSSEQSRTEIDWQRSHEIKRLYETAR